MTSLDELHLADPAAGPVPFAGRDSLFDAISGSESSASPDVDSVEAPTPRRFGVRTRSGPRLRTLRSRTSRLVVSAVAVAGLVTVGVIWQVTGTGRAGGATPAAAAALTRAADTAISVRDPVVGPDQYLRVTTRAFGATFAQGPDGAPVSWLDIQTFQLFVPGDTSRPWVQRTTPRVPYSPDDEAKAGANGAGGPVGAPMITRAPGGAFYGRFPGDWEAPTPGFLRALPRDPDALLAQIHRDSQGKGTSPDGEALALVTAVLACGFAPADLRAALFRVATRIPGVRVLQAQANLDGRTGVAIGRDQPTEGNRGVRRETIFDPATGQVIGSRDVTIDASGGFPAGTTILFSSVRTEVVDSAP